MRELRAMRGGILFHIQDLCLAPLSLHHYQCSQSSRSPRCIQELRLLEALKTMLAVGVGVAGRGLCRYGVEADNPGLLEGKVRLL